MTIKEIEWKLTETLDKNNIKYSRKEKYSKMWNKPPITYIYEKKGYKNEVLIAWFKEDKVFQETRKEIYDCEKVFEASKLEIIEDVKKKKKSREERNREKANVEKEKEMENLELEKEVFKIIREYYGNNDEFYEKIDELETKYSYKNGYSAAYTYSIDEEGYDMKTYMFNLISIDFYSTIDDRSKEEIGMMPGTIKNVEISLFNYPINKFSELL